MTSGTTTAVKGQVKGQMKGLLKGLRYISQIFDEEEEKEIQIGFPTDVKHLAHIGADNEKVAAPSWMTEFKEAADQSGTVNPTKTPEENNSSKSEGKKSHIRKLRHRSTEGQSTMSSPGREGSSEGSTKPSRRHHSSEASTRRASRHSSEDEKPPSTTTTTKHRRKTKTSSEEKEGSTRRASEDKDGSSRRAPRNRRASKGDSLTDFSFTSDPGLGPGPQ